MKRPDIDILIAGGGIAGMIACLVFAREGFRVTCVDASHAPGAQTPPDLRSTAFLMPAVALLREAGIFDSLQTFSAPLRTMRIADAGGADPTIRESVDFDATDAGETQFGWNIPNAPLRDALLSQITAHQDITMIWGDAVIAMTPRLHTTILRLESGKQITAHLAIAADGRNSRLRDLAGIDKTTIRYGQKALVFAVSHDMPHQAVSTEIHRSGGPFTLVPLSDPNRSAVVWMETGPNADTLLNLTESEFEAAANTRYCHLMGPLKLASKRGIWPIISQYAHALTCPRMALIGEAAHVVPPIGAQGLNMSLADIATLRDIIADADTRQDIGTIERLDAFQRARWNDMRLRVTGIDALNRASMAATQPIRDLRSMGLSYLGRSPSLKKSAIKKGLGV